MTSPVSPAEMNVITLGTAGGPRWWHPDGADRAGISTAITVGDRFYLIDVGDGAGRRVRQAGLDMSGLGGVFLTHLHSDHTVGLPALVLFGMHYLQDRATGPVPVYGPGDRGMLPPVSERAVVAPQPVAPHDPTPGTTGLVRGIVDAYATDLNDRVLDSLRTHPLELFDLHDIPLPHDIGYHPNDAASPEMAPFLVFEDDRVRVTATLVDHPPVAPAFAFRVESEHGSVTISGDTCESDNLVHLAADTDLLLHEAIDFEWVEQLYGARSDGEGRASRDHHYRSHTSVEGACRIAERANARRLALHHLVPGHADASVWARGEARLPGRFLVPGDLDIIPIDSRNPRVRSAHFDTARA
ncbi:MBL fold metallo-hydrolase [Microbacterium sp. G2-8]|uniref:MBL fold metallo-hydrolase n=1 Tax=Microbacterium sp. G2-8 TaxID=2842454 RepID=UPI001C8984F1|nr:MBL fold metallo-hydrolase [Microbacterium sp. G2-8]